MKLLTLILIVFFVHTNSEYYSTTINYVITAPKISESLVSKVHSKVNVYYSRLTPQMNFNMTIRYKISKEKYKRLDEFHSKQIGNRLDVFLTTKEYVQGSYNGYGFLCTICSPDFLAVRFDLSNKFINNYASVVAHEIGHYFCLNHYGPGETSIMASNNPMNENLKNMRFVSRSLVEWSKIDFKNQRCLRYVNSTLIVNHSDRKYKNILLILGLLNLILLIFGY